MPMGKKMERWNGIHIYTVCLEGHDGNLTCRMHQGWGLFERDSRCWFRKGNHYRNEFQSKRHITPKLGGMCWHRFLTRVKINGEMKPASVMKKWAIYWWWAWGSNLGSIGVCSLEISRWYLYWYAEGIFQIRLGLGWRSRGIVCFVFRKSLSFCSRYVPAVID
jgi:hypothetical protein